MSMLDKLRLGPRLALVFGLIILLLLLIVGVAVGGLRSVGSDLELLVGDRYLKVKLVTEVAEQLNVQARAARNALLVDDTDQRNEAMKEIETASGHIAEDYAKLEPLLLSPEGKAMFATLMKEREAFRATMQLFLRQVKAADVDGAKGILFDRLRPQQLEYMKQLAALSDFQEKLMDESAAAAHASVQRSTLLMAGTAVLALLFASLSGLAVARSVTRPVSQLVSTLQAVADGDLSVEVQATRSDEIGLLQQALAHTVENLRKVVGQVRSGVDSVTTASSQIAAGNQDLSQRTEEQASSLQQTASSMEEVGSSRVDLQACKLEYSIVSPK